LAQPEFAMAAVSIIRGTIIEQIPNEKIKIQTSEGNVFVYKYDEIEKITKEPKIINPNAYQINTNNFSDEVKHHKSKGIACIVTGATFFAVGMPFMLQGLRIGTSSRSQWRSNCVYTYYLY
jgi:hypothetical protein